MSLRIFVGFNGRTEDIRRLTYIHIYTYTEIRSGRDYQACAKGKKRTGRIRYAARRNWTISTLHKASVLNKPIKCSFFVPILLFISHCFMKNLLFHFRYWIEGFSKRPKTQKLFASVHRAFLKNTCSLCLPVTFTFCPNRDRNVKWCRQEALDGPTIIKITNVNQRFSLWISMII